MGIMDLNKIAITMGKVMKMLSEIEPNITNERDVYDYKEELCTLAYVCRKGILLRSEANPSFISHPHISIRIPTGIFSSKKMSIESGLNMTIGKIKQLAGMDSIVVLPMIENILNGGELYYKYDKLLSGSLKGSI